MATKGPWLHQDEEHPQAWLAPLITDAAAFFGTLAPEATAAIANVKYLCLDTNAEFRERMNNHLTCRNIWKELNEPSVHCQAPMEPPAAEVHMWSRPPPQQQRSHPSKRRYPMRL